MTWSSIYGGSMTPQITQIRRIAEMKFAQEFSPDAFAEHVAETRSGETVLVRLPAEDDPMLGRVRKVREREYVFIDTLDEYFAEFHDSMQSPYQDWREATFDEAIARQQLLAQARARTIAGIIGIAAGNRGPDQRQFDDPDGWHGRHHRRCHDFEERSREKG